MLTPNHLLPFFSCECIQRARVLVHTAHILTADCVMSLSAIRTWDPLREAALRLQYVFGAAVPGEHVPVSGK